MSSRLGCRKTRFRVHFGGGGSPGGVNFWIREILGGGNLGGGLGGFGGIEVGLR